MTNTANVCSPDIVYIRPALPADVDSLVRLINAAFRVERPYIEGNRIDAAGVRSYMAKGKFLVAEDSTGLAACVYVQIDMPEATWGCLGWILCGREPGSAAR